MDWKSLIAGAVARKERLLRRFEAAVQIEPGRRGGDPETVVTVDHLLPAPTSDHAERARWRLATARHRLVGFPAGVDALAEWHRADPRKGRRLVAGDLRNQNRAAAILSWHFESGQGLRKRPHLITSLAVRHDVAGALRGEYLVALWLLTCIALAIDRKTVRRGRVGMVLDNAIELDASLVAAFGFTRGPKRGGYRGRYYELRA